MTVPIVLRAMVRPKLELLELCFKALPIILLLLGGSRRKQRGQCERIKELIGRLDRHAHYRTKDWLRPDGQVQRLLIPPVEESEYLSHDVVEDDTAAEVSLLDGRKASRFVELAVVEAQRNRCFLSKVAN